MPKHVHILSRDNCGSICVPRNANDVFIQLRLAAAPIPACSALTYLPHVNLTPMQRNWLGTDLQQSTVKKRREWVAFDAAVMVDGD